MKIPIKILEKWNSLKSRGDLKEMAQGDESKRVGLSRAMTKGECNVETFTLLRDFYAEREKLIETAN